MILTLKRHPSLGDSTTGDLFIDGAWACHTLEDVVREVPGQDVSQWKIKGQTAIPAGRYKVTLEMSNRFGPDTLTINQVPGFSSIRMHAGNTCEDTEGCPLLGMSLKDGQIVGGTSRPAVLLVKSHVMGALHDGEEVWIDVENSDLDTGTGNVA